VNTLKSSKQFSSNSALNKNAWQQVQHVLSTDGPRLVDRTRVLRGESSKGDADKVIDPEIFDDSDFYQALLKDAVENQLLDIGAFATIGKPRLTEQQTTHHSQHSSPPPTRRARARRTSIPALPRAVVYGTPTC
jgi:hypothetical protein